MRVDLTGLGTYSGDLTITCFPWLAIFDISSVHLKTNTQMAETCVLRAAMNDYNYNLSKAEPILG